MKKLPLAATIFLTTSACLVALTNAANRQQQQLQTIQAAGLAQTQQIEEMQVEQARLEAKVSDLRHELQSSISAKPIDPELAGFLLTNDIMLASSDTQERLLASFGWGGNSSDRFVLVSKAALTNSTLKPLQNFPNGEELTAAVRGVLAITPEEQQSVESVFAQAFTELGDWARKNIQREAAAGDMLVCYTIPTDPTYAQMQAENLFSNISAIIGNERGELMRRFFEHYRIYEDGYIGERTNIFSIHRVSAPPGLGYRAGWKTDRSEAINTHPEPIKPNRFPAAFRFVFPGGWEELAQREGFELPELFQQHNAR
jgi:hypothetical protein